MRDSLQLPASAIRFRLRLAPARPLLERAGRAGRAPPRGGGRGDGRGGRVLHARRGWGAADRPARRAGAPPAALSLGAGGPARAAGGRSASPGAAARRGAAVGRRAAGLAVAGGHVCRDGRCQGRGRRPVLPAPRLHRVRPCAAANGAAARGLETSDLKRTRREGDTDTWEKAPKRRSAGD